MESSASASEYAGPTRKLAAILSADVVGYSRLMADNHRGTLETLTAYRQVMHDRTEEQGRRESIAA